MVKNVIKGSFPMSKVLVLPCEGNSYVCWKNEDIRLFYHCNMVKNVIKGSFPMSKVLVFEGNSYVVEKMKILDYFMIAMVKMWLKAHFSYVKSFSFRG